MDLIGKLYNQYQETWKVSTDSRKIEKGCIFFALQGPNFNANTFAATALDQGAALAVIDDAEYQQDERTLLVEDTLKTLQDLANYHRRQLQIPVLAITGSNGKTTTKELVREVLGKKYKVLATLGNLNNHIGVPLTILSIVPNQIELAVIEMGANKIGDIRELCDIAEPDYGVITNIGKAHLEGFGGFEGVLRGKTELFDFIQKHGGKVFINTANEILKNLAKRFSSPVLYPGEGDYLNINLERERPFITYRDERGNLVDAHLSGTYNFDNIATALCIGKFFGVDADAANQAISSYQPTNNRSQLIRHQDNLIYLDAYNANPSSMKAAIENFAHQEGDQKVLILGDMFELGRESDQEHLELGRLTNRPEFTRVFLVGQNSRIGVEGNPQAKWFETKEELKQYLLEQKISNSTIFIKASRGMALETLIESLK